MYGTWSALLALWIMTIISMNVLPEQIVTHFGAGGYSYGDRSTNVAMSATFTVIVVSMLATLRLMNPHSKWVNTPVKVTEANAEQLYMLLRHMIVWLALVTAFVPLPIMIDFFFQTLGVNVYLIAVLPVIFISYFVIVYYYLMKTLNVNAPQT